VTQPLEATVPSPWNEEGAVQSLLESQRPRLVALFARYRIPPEDSEDLLQQALLALVYQQERIRTPGAWLVGTVRNCCRNYWTARRRQVYDAVDRSVLDALAVEETPNQERHDLRHDLALLMEALPPRPRKLIRLCYLLGYEPAEAAAALGYSPASVSKTTSRKSPAACSPAAPQVRTPRNRYTASSEKSRLGLQTATSGGRAAVSPRVLKKA
jgi:RNA polymerase sigma factor (sigma-70 family)